MCMVGTGVATPGRRRLTGTVWITIVWRRQATVCGGGRTSCAYDQQRVTAAAAERQEAADGYGEAKRRVRDGAMSAGVANRTAIEDESAVKTA